MKKLWILTIVLLMLVISGGLLVANTANAGEEFSITISPSTLVLSNTATWVTVHSNIPYDTVNTVTLTLNGIPAVFTKADSCGDLVVKFNPTDVKNIISPGQATLTLAGELDNGFVFEVSDTITVKR